VHLLANPEFSDLSHDLLIGTFGEICRTLGAAKSKASHAKRAKAAKENLLAI
jgi:hypothetical protein